MRFGHTALPWLPANARENVQLKPERLDQPLKWRRSRMVFVNSMSDLFHEEVPDGFIDQVFSTMGQAERHVFQILTKRPERMRDYTRRRHPSPLPNVWLGVSIENRRFIDRADALRDTPAAIRFVSAEPLLGPLVAGDRMDGCRSKPRVERGPQTGLSLEHIDWLIVGGESGPRHRRLDPDWVRDLQRLAAASRTAFFFKQWGGRTPKARGRTLDGNTWDEMPEHLAAPTAF